MKVFFSAQPLNVFTIKNLTNWDYPEHMHHFYELILVEEGSGEHVINNVTFPYKAKDLFLLTPRDAHEFIIKSPTTLKFLKFTEQIFAEKLEENPNPKWRSVIENAIINSNNQQGDIIVCRNDRRYIFELYNVLANEYDKVCLFSRHAILDIFGAILSIVARNLSQHSLYCQNTSISESSKITNILLYVRNNIKNPEKLSLKNLSEEFHLSPAYLGIFIKKQTGYNLQNIVVSTRIKMARQLLTQSNLTISEIAYKLGFTDGSHFNKMIKKYLGVNPKDLRPKHFMQEEKKVLDAIHQTPIDI